MRFGTQVYLRRGGHPGTSPGSYRYVRARYVGAMGYQVRCVLLQDDDLAVVGPKARGEAGWWSRSIMTEVGDQDAG